MEQSLGEFLFKGLVAGLLRHRLHFSLGSGEPVVSCYTVSVAVTVTRHGFAARGAGLIIIVYDRQLEQLDHQGVF